MEIEEAYAEPTQPVLEHSTSTKQSIMKTNKADNQTWVRRIRNCQKQRKKERKEKKKKKRAEETRYNQERRKRKNLNYKHY